jgi:hypothetical protein
MIVRDAGTGGGGAGGAAAPAIYQEGQGGRRWKIFVINRKNSSLLL